MCETIAKEAQKIHVSVIEKRFGKFMTIIKGVDESKINIKDLTKKLKSKLACGGTYKNKEIELQGDHKRRVRDILVGEGFPEDVIEID